MIPVDDALKADGRKHHSARKPQHQGRTRMKPGELILQATTQANDTDRSGHCKTGHHHGRHSLPVAP
jgi:hypothetical protein